MATLKTLTQLKKEAAIIHADIERRAKLQEDGGHDGHDRSPPAQQSCAATSLLVPDDTATSRRVAFRRKTTVTDLTKIKQEAGSETTEGTALQFSAGAGASYQVSGAASDINYNYIMWGHSQKIQLQGVSGGQRRNGFKQLLLSLVTCMMAQDLSSPLDDPFIKITHKDVHAVLLDFVL